MDTTEEKIDWSPPPVPNIPPKYEHFRQFLNTIHVGRICRFIAKHYTVGMNVNPLGDSPILAAIFLYNGRKHDFETIRDYSYKYFGKHASGIIMNFMIEQDMGLDLVRQYWENRNTRTSNEFYEVLKVADDKYIDYLLSTDKFYRLMQTDIESSKIAQDLSDPRILEIGKKYKRFNKLCIEIFNKYDDTRFISEEARDVFVF